MSKSKKKKTPLRCIPVSMADLNRAKDEAADRGTKVALVVLLSVLLDKEGYDAERLQRVFNYAMSRSEDIAKKRASIQDWVTVLRDEYGVMLHF